MDRWASDCSRLHANGRPALHHRNSTIDDLYGWEAGIENDAQLCQVWSTVAHTVNRLQRAYYGVLPDWCDDTRLRGLFRANATSDWDKCHFRFTGVFLLCARKNTAAIFGEVLLCGGNVIWSAWYIFCIPAVYMPWLLQRNQKWNPTPRKVPIVYTD